GGRTTGLRARVRPAGVGGAGAPPRGLAVRAAYLRAACRGMAEPLFTQFVMERVPPRLRGTTSSLETLGWGIGMTLGPPVSGEIQVRAGFLPACTLSGLGYALSAASIWFVFARRPRSQPDTARRGDG